MANIIAKGIDVSEHNGTIDWKKVKAAGVDFAIIRAGYGKLAAQIDKRYLQNYDAARAAGVKVGAYWYSYATTEAEAKQEAQVCLQLLASRQFEYPIYFDIEEKKQLDLGKAKFSAIIKAFCSTVEAAGYYTGVYTSASVASTLLTDEIKTKYDMWVAHWGVTKPSYNGNYGMWQYKVGAKGSVNGITGEIDMDYAYKNYPTIIKNAGLNNFPKETATATQPPKATKETITIEVTINNKKYKGDVTEV